MKKFTILTYIIFSVIHLIAQETAIGNWTDHLSYSRGTGITTDNKRIYCATTSGLFIYNINDNSIERRNKINGLSEVNIQSLKYNKYNNKLLIIYNSGGIDIINTLNGQLVNIPFLRNATTISNKDVNSITFENEVAYISLNFGIMAINTDRNEIIDTYRFGTSGGDIIVNSTSKIGDYIIAATNAGLYKGNLNNNLLDFNNWNKINSFSNEKVEYLYKIKNQVYFNIKDANGIDSVYMIDNSLNIIHEKKIEARNYEKLIEVNNELILLYDNNKISIYDSTLNKTNSFEVFGNGLISITKTINDVFIVNTGTPLMQYNLDGTYIRGIKPIGPNNNDVFNITASDGIIWTVSGAYDFAINNAFKYINLNKYENGNWKNFNNYNTSSLTGVYDPISVEVNPENPKHIFVCTWGSGLYEMINEPPFIRYDETNSTIEERQAFANWRGVSDVSYDLQGNLWVVNTHVPRALSVRTVDNNWFNFDLSSNPQVVHEDRMTEILISNNGYKWVAMPLSNNILVFDDNGTIQNKNDDRHIILTQEQGNGNLPGSRGITMEIDKSGQIWVGTSEGVVVHYNPDNVFDANSRDFEEVIINDGNNNEVVLAGAVINDIEIDGANRKWIATEGSGVFLFSPDLKQQILHFTEENSPLISDNIKTIAFDEVTGEVYFGTSIGIVSYKSEVITGSDDFSDVVIYPNPVQSNYNGPIAIKGLMDNTTVKITDINGTLVNEVITEGGQAIWNGTNFNNEKVSSGVYLIFNSAEDEFGNLSTQIGKVLFLK